MSSNQPQAANGPTPSRVQELLTQVWMEQACRRAEDRSRVLEALMKDGARTPGTDTASTENHGRGSLRPLAEEAAAALAHAFANGPPTDPAHCIWHAFPRLDRGHRQQLADLLIAEIAGGAP